MSAHHLGEVPIGTRVVVRYLIEDGERATDVLGTLRGRTESTLTVESRQGPIEIPRHVVVAGKPIPPAPPRRQRRPRHPLGR